MSDANRESWLTEISLQVRPLFKGFRMPVYRLTCGWPSRNAVGGGSIRLGECHGPKDDKTGIYDIFVSPLLDDSLEVAGTVMHEMAHVVAGIPAGHKGLFVTLCKHVGLTKGKPTVAMPGVLLNEKLQRIIEIQGKYPHTKIQLVAKQVKPSSNIALVCTECGCKFSIASKWIEQSGMPTCGCGSPMSEKEE